MEIEQRGADKAAGMVDWQELPSLLVKPGHGRTDFMKVVLMGHLSGFTPEC